MLKVDLCFLSFFQFIIGEDGACGANGSHALVDGTVWTTIVDYVVAYM